ncbi:MAG TPA: hypothetical protein VFW17_03955 [Ktedonobacterales bacterium]|nr:hypothetical protein [Ktedonobacterales bacterium]
MSISEVLPVVLVVLFWLAAFVFAWWFTARALRAPIEYEEAHETEAHTHASH